MAPPGILDSRGFVLPVPLLSRLLEAPVGAI
jgi:hypothetical protein